MITLPLAIIRGWLKVTVLFTLRDAGVKVPVPVWVQVQATLPDVVGVALVLS